MTWELAVELTVRIVATAAVVIGITLAVERLGPKIGGALAGLPIVMCPAFFFLLRDQSVGFGADAAAASLMSLGATQAFLMGYILVAARTRAAIFAAILAWAVSAWALSFVPLSPWLALTIFVAAMLGFRIWAGYYVRPLTPRRMQGTHVQLILRGLMAGLLVGGVTVASALLGPVWAGFLIAYPIGLTVMSVTIHQRAGADITVVTLRAIMLGISSLAAFTFALAVLLGPLGSVPAFVAALGAGLLVTVALIVAPVRTV